MNMKTSVVKRACGARSCSRVLALALSVAFVVPPQFALAAGDTEGGAANSAANAAAVSESDVDSSNLGSLFDEGAAGNKTGEKKDTVTVVERGKTSAAAAKDSGGRKIASVLGKLREKRKESRAARAESEAKKNEAEKLDGANAAAKIDTAQAGTDNKTDSGAQKRKIAVLLKWKDTPAKSSRKNAKTKLASKDAAPADANSTKTGDTTGAATTADTSATTTAEQNRAVTPAAASATAGDSSAAAVAATSTKSVTADAAAAAPDKNNEGAAKSAPEKSDGEEAGAAEKTSALPAETSPVAQAQDEAKQERPSGSALQKSEATASDGPVVIDESPAALDREKQSVALGVTAGSVSVEPTQALSESDGPLVVDNDEEVEAKQGIKFEELPTTDGKTRVRIGAHFPVVVSSQLCSKTTKKGDPIEARLKYDLKIGDRMVAEKGDTVRGHINYSLPARTILHSLVSPERWYRNSGCIGVRFDEIITKKGEHLPLVAAPAQKARIVKNKAEGRELGVNHNGQVTGPWAQQLRYKAVRIGLNAALSPAGVFSFGAMPVALGLIGAANPNFAFSKPVGLNVRHRRIKGFCWGFLSGIPGSWLIEDTVVKGQEAVIKPGDEFLVEFKEEFTGEPASDASLLPGSTGKVKGEVIRDPKNKKKK